MKHFKEAMKKVKPKMEADLSHYRQCYLRLNN